MENEIAKCGCGRTYSLAEWRALKYQGVQRVGDSEPDLSLRDCTCGSTLAVHIENQIDRIRRRRDIAERRWLTRKFIAGIDERTRLFGFLCGWDQIKNYIELNRPRAVTIGEAWLAGTKQGML